MPIYVYRCQECSGIHEALIRDGKTEPHDCPACGHGRLERIVATFASTGQGVDSGDCAMPSGMCGMGGCGTGGCGHSH